MCESRSVTILVSRYYKDEADGHLKVRVARPGIVGGVKLKFPYITSEIGERLELESLGS